MGLAVQADVEAVLLRALTDTEQPHLDRLLEMASAKAERYCGRRFARVEDDVITVGQLGDAEVYLPSPPVEAVTAVTLGGAALATSLYEWSEQGRIGSLAGWWSGPLTVTYTHGYATIPADVALGVATIVAERFSGPEPGVRSETIAGFATAWERGASSLGMSAAAAEHLDPYRIRAGAIPIVTDDPVAMGAYW